MPSARLATGAEAEDLNRELVELRQLVRTDYEVVFEFSGGRAISDRKDDDIGKKQRKTQSDWVSGLLEELGIGQDRINSKSWTSNNVLKLRFSSPSVGKHTDGGDDDDEEDEDDDDRPEVAFEDATGCGIVIGPESTALMKAGRFRNLWGGPDRCQLRRFKDGSVRESVAVQRDPASNRWDFVLDQLKHLALAKPSVKDGEARLLSVTFPRSSSPLMTAIRQEAEEAEQRADRTRKVAEELADLVRSCGSPELPVRRAVASCDCLYGGQMSHHLKHASLNLPEYFLKAPTTSQSPDGLEGVSGRSRQVKEKCHLVPEASEPLPIKLVITEKTNFSPDTFKDLATVHLVELGNCLHAKAGLPWFIQGGDLVTSFKSVNFRLFAFQDLKEGRGFSKEALIDNLRRARSAHPCIWAAKQLVQRWTSSCYLDFVLPDLVSDLMLSVAVVDREVVTVGAGGGTLPKGPARSGEAAFLRFLYLLSFWDFEKNILFFDKASIDKVQKFGIESKFLNSRQSFPALCIVTPHDDPALPCTFTRGLARDDLVRTANCAKHTLSAFVKAHLDKPYSFFDSSMYKRSSLVANSFDALVELRPLKRFARAGEVVGGSKNTVPNDGRFCLGRLDVVDSFLQELRGAFSSEAFFHYSTVDHKIGIKLKPGAILDSFIEDVQILGKGLILTLRNGSDGSRLLILPPDDDEDMETTDA